MILAIDTATDSASVALLRGEAVYSEFSWSTRGHHSRQLFTVVRQILSLADAQIAEIQQVAVTIGPGSFNGLRAGVSAAKGIAMGLHVPLAGFSTLDVIGYQSSLSATKVCALIPAGRGEMYVGRYASARDNWRRVAEYERVSVHDVAATYAENELLCGPGAPEVAGVLAGLGRTERTEPPPWRVRRAAYLAELARQYFDAGGEDQLLNLELLYLRRSSAEEKRETAGRDV